MAIIHVLKNQYINLRNPYVPILMEHAFNLSCDLYAKGVLNGKITTDTLNATPLLDDVIDQAMIQNGVSTDTVSYDSLAIMAGDALPEMEITHEDVLEKSHGKWFSIIVNDNQRYTVV